MAGLFGTERSIVVVDNYDSFTYNLVQALAELGAAVRVVQNDRATVEDIASLDPGGLLLGPGPGRPEGAGITLACVDRFSGQVPVLGVCLGHQAIAQALGGRIGSATRLMHGRTSAVTHDGVGLFEGVPSPFAAARYHSLAVDCSALPAELSASAWAEDGEIMALTHQRWALYGVQFHPESFMTVHGKTVLANFLREVRRAQAVIAPLDHAAVAS